MLKNFLKYPFVILLLLALALTGCQNLFNGTDHNRTPQTTAVPATPTITEKPTRTLVVCLGQEPTDLYLYGDQSRSKWGVLEALYDGPIDTVDFLPQPVILEALPEIANGGTQVLPVAVTEGMLVVDAQGNLTALKEGEEVLPAECTSSECAITWDGKSELSMDQMASTFRLKPGLLWSDGTPLTAADSVFSYQVERAASGPALTGLQKWTAAYEAVDETTVVWRGIPGFGSTNTGMFFWSPLPIHSFEGISPDQIGSQESALTRPLGWGAYQLDEWVRGDHIRMVRNPNYFRAGEGLPHFDVLVYRFLNRQGEDDLSALLSGTCDIIDQSSLVQGQLQLVRELEKNGKVKVVSDIGPEWEGISFGILPATYDDGINLFQGDRPDFFSDVRVRQAVARCINREEIVAKTLAGYSAVPALFLPSNHPAYKENLSLPAYDLEEGNRLLEEAGWVDADATPSTPRIARGIPNVPDGTPFSVSFLTSDSAFHRRLAEDISNSLLNCGIAINVDSRPVSQLYQAGKTGPIFGRAYDLAEMAWSAGRQLPCYLYLSTEIPSEKNNWLGKMYGGANSSGFASADYDQACQQLLTAGRNESAYQDASITLQTILADELPFFSLFYYVKIDVTRPDLCHLGVNNSTRSNLWNVELVDYGANCQ